VPSSVGTASACIEECTAASLAFATACTVTQTGETPTCPAGCQDAIDTMYSDCGGCESDDGAFDDSNAEMKTTMEAIGCAGAAQTAPLFAVLAAVANHFLN
jgi:hypothetical protein